MAETPTVLEELCEQADLTMDEVLNFNKEEWTEFSRSIFQNNSLSHARISRERFLRLEELRENKEAEDATEDAAGDSAIVSPDNTPSTARRQDSARRERKKRSRSTNQRDGSSKKKKARSRDTAIAAVAARPDRIASTNRRPSELPSIQDQQSDAEDSDAGKKPRAVRTPVHASQKAPRQHDDSVRSKSSSRASAPPQKRHVKKLSNSASTRKSTSQADLKPQSVQASIDTPATTEDDEEDEDVNTQDDHDDDDTQDGDERRVYEIDINGNDIIAEYENVAVVARRFHMKESTVEDCCRGRVARMDNLYFRFADEYNEEQLAAKPRKIPPFADVSGQLKPAPKQSTAQIKRAPAIKKKNVSIPSNKKDSVVRYRLLPRCEWKPNLCLKKMQRFVPTSQRTMYMHPGRALPGSLLSRESLFKETLWPALLQNGWTSIEFPKNKYRFISPTEVIDLTSRIAVLRHASKSDPWKSIPAIQAAVAICIADFEIMGKNADPLVYNKATGGRFHHYYLDCSKEFCFIRTKKLAGHVGSIATRSTFEKSGWTFMSESAAGRQFGFENNPDTPTQVQPPAPVQKSSLATRGLHKEYVTKKLHLLDPVPSKKKSRADRKEKAVAVNRKTKLLLPKTKWKPDLHMKRMQRHVPHSMHLARFSKVGTKLLASNRQLFVDTVWNVLVPYGWKINWRSDGSICKYLSPLGTVLTRRHNLLRHILTDSRWSKTDVLAAVSTFLFDGEERDKKRSGDGTTKSTRNKTSHDFCHLRLKQTDVSDAMKDGFTKLGWTVEMQQGNNQETNMSNAANANTVETLSQNTGIVRGGAYSIVLFKDLDYDPFPQKKTAQGAIRKSRATRAQKPLRMVVPLLVPQCNWQPDRCLTRICRYIPQEEQPSYLEWGEQLMSKFRPRHSNLFGETVWKMLKSHGWTACQAFDDSHVRYNALHGEASFTSRSSVAIYLLTDKKWKKKYDVQAALSVFLADTESRQMMKEASTQKIVTGDDNLRSQNHVELNSSKAFYFVRLKVKGAEQIDDFKMKGWSEWKGARDCKVKSGERSFLGVAFHRDETGASAPKPQRVPSKRKKNAKTIHTTMVQLD